MCNQSNTTFVKHTNFKLFGKTFFTKEEIYTETNAEGEPFKIIINQDYYNKEFKINDNKSNNQNT